MTDDRGVASVEAPLGKVEISVGGAETEAWIAVDRETVVDITVGRGVAA